MGKNKPIVEVDKNGKVLSYHEAGREAALLAGINPGIISSILNGYRKNYQGRKWRYARPEEIEFFQGLIARIDNKPVEEPIIIPPIPEEPVETIPAEKPTIEDDLSPFERLLNRTKKN